VIYRYSLRRRWQPSVGGKAGRVVWVMLNPSTADDTHDDPTIRKCIGFTKRWGYSDMVVANLFAYRATDPADLWRTHLAGGDIIGAENDAQFHAINATPMADQLVVCAWGAGRLIPVMLSRIVAVEELLVCHPLHCLGFTKGSDPRGNFPQPRHPLMLPYATQLERYPDAHEGGCICERCRVVIQAAAQESGF